MNLLTTLTAALIGAYLFESIGVPAGALIGAMISVGLVNVLAPGVIAELPSSVEFIAYVILGWLIGQGFTKEVLQMLGRNSLIVVSVVIALLIASALIALLIIRIGQIDVATAFLATSPGGLSQMAALGAAVDANVGLVATIHVLRVVAVVVLAPFVIRFIGATR